MHEQIKIKEAKYFLKQMTSHVNDSEAFTFNLSAFIAAARSVLQYALEEAKCEAGGQSWYDEQVTNKEIIKFFKDKRDINIHSKPISPSAKVSVSLKSTIQVSGSFEAIILHKDGSTEEIASAESKPSSSPTPNSESKVSYEYYFSDWKGREDVLNLCNTYMSEIESLIANGVSKGILSET